MLLMLVDDRDYGSGTRTYFGFPFRALFISKSETINYDVCAAPPPPMILEFAVTLQ
jgi:hypothetical protein